MERPVEVTKEVSTPSIDVTLSYKGGHIRENARAWGKEISEPVFTYKVYANILGKGKLAFYFHDSINNCNAKARQWVQFFKDLTPIDIANWEKFFNFSRFPDLKIYKAFSMTKIGAETEATLQSILDNVHKSRSIIDTRIGYAYIYDIINGKYDDKAQPKYMTEDELPWAFRCYVDDAIAGSMDISEFQSEFGYTDAGECIRVHNACKLAAKAFEEIGIDEQKLCDILNELSEAGIE